MKVALLLSGQPRDFEYCYYNSIFPVIIKNINPDIYLYCSCDNDTALQLIQLLKPKKIVAEKEDKKEDLSLWFNKKAPETNVNSILQMTRKIFKCSQLIDEDYDWIIKYRFSSIINGLIINKDFLRSRNNNIYHIPIGGDWAAGLNDNLCLSSHKNMMYYCNLYNKIQEYCLDQGLVFHPEKLLGHHLKGKKIQRFECEMFLRKWKNEKWQNSYYNYRKI